MCKIKERAETSARSFQCSAAALNRGAAAVLQQLRLQGGGEALQGGGALLDPPRLPGQPGLPRDHLQEGDGSLLSSNQVKDTESRQKMAK